MSQGSHCESSWIELLRGFLPNRYGITKGFVFDSHGNISEQIDIIIYDTTYSPLIYTTKSGEKYVTAESVYAIFECKPKINKASLKYAEDKISSVTNLYRTSRQIYIAGRITNPRTPPRIIGGLLANTSIKEQPLAQNLDSISPSIKIAFAASGRLFFRCKCDTRIISNNALLAFFYKLLDMLYELGTVAAIDIREYSKNTSDLQDLFKEKDG